jgi:hypothetical protein
MYQVCYTVGSCYLSVVKYILLKYFGISLWYKYTCSIFFNIYGTFNYSKFFCAYFFSCTCTCTKFYFVTLEIEKAWIVFLSHHTLRISLFSTYCTVLVRVVNVPEFYYVDDCSSWNWSPVNIIQFFGTSTSAVIQNVIIFDFHSVYKRWSGLQFWRPVPKANVNRSAFLIHIALINKFNVKKILYLIILENVTERSRAILTVKNGKLPSALIGCTRFSWYFFR